MSNIRQDVGIKGVMIKGVKNIISIIFALLISLLILFPVYWMIVTALKTTAENQAVPPTLYPHNLDLSSFAWVFDSSPFISFIGNSLFLAGSAGFLALLVGTPAAFAFSKYDFHGKDILMGMMLAGLMFPGVAIIVPEWRVIIGLGLFDTRLGLVFIYAATVTPIVVFLMKGFFDDFPQSILEAAKVDQCSTFEIFRHVLLPNATGPIFTSFTFAFLIAWNELVFALTLLASESKFTVTLGLLNLLNRRAVPEWNLVAAASVVISIPILAGLYFAQKYYVQAITGGAIKK